MEDLAGGILNGSTSRYRRTHPGSYDGRPTVRGSIPPGVTDACGVAWVPWGSELVTIAVMSVKMPATTAASTGTRMDSRLLLSRLFLFGSPGATGVVTSSPSTVDRDGGTIV
jgi:hypothetical protein